MRKFFCSELPAPGGEVTLEGREAEHLFRVLRARDGEELELLSGDGRKALAVVRGKGRVEVLKITGSPEEKVRFHLFFAPPRRNRLDLLLTQAVEIGVAELHPVLFARGVAESEPNERWQLHLREGCKQSGNPRLPVVHPLVSLDRALADFAAVNGTGYYGSVVAAETAAAADSAGDVGWIVGPEGGFTDGETAAIEGAGWRPLHLGPHILRLETAAVCGIAVLRKMLLGIVPLLVCAMIFAGCGRDGREQIEKNPLILKARQYVKEGDAVLARDFYRRALRRYPASPLLHFEIAQLCDEALGAYAEAIYHYDEYLRLLPEDAPGYKEAGLYRRLAVNRFILEQNPELLKTMGAGEAENPQIKEENQQLRRQIEKMKLMIHRQHQQLTELRRSAAAAVQKNAAAEKETAADGGRFHIIVSGDTPGGIAKRYRVPLRELLRHNGLKSDTILHIGRKLVIPAAARQ